MKKIFTIISILLFVVAACEKDAEIENPKWINDWIAEIDDDEYCVLCEIHRYEFEGKFYYELYSPVFSCRPCQVHHANGDDVDWTDFSVEDYLNERRNKTLIYKKPAG